MKTIEQLAVEVKLVYVVEAEWRQCFLEDEDIREYIEKFAALILAEHSPGIIALARKLALEEAAEICRNLNDAECDTGFGHDKYDCAEAILEAASKGETP